MDKKNPLIAFLVYLIRNGCDWEATNKAGKKASDILREKGYSKELIELLDQTASKCKKLPVGPNGCMGRNGECAAVATYRFSCPHKAPIDACPECFPLTFNLLKCGCKDEEMSSIPKADEKVSSIPKPEEKAQEVVTPNEQKNGADLKWVDDGSEKGHIEDGEGNQFVIWNKRARQDGSFGYRCKFKSESGVQCPAMARRFFTETEQDFAVVLESLHQHSGQKKTTKSAARKRVKTNTGNYYFLRFFF